MGEFQQPRKKRDPPFRQTMINPLQFGVAYLYPLKTSENLKEV